MAKNELLPFADGEDANVLPTNQWEALTDILENGFQSGIARSEQVNRVLAQGAVASYVLGQLIVDELNQDATLDKDTLYQNLVSALQENAKDVCLPLSGGNVTGNLSVQSKNVVRSVNGTTADASGNVTLELGGAVSKKYNTTFSVAKTNITKTVTGLTANKPVYFTMKNAGRNNVGVSVTSGALFNSSTLSSYNNGTIVVSSSKTRTAVTIPTGTSLAFSFLGGSDTAQSVTFVVYQ